MTPEQKAREEIDRQLALCGWVVQDRSAINIMASPGVAVREFPTAAGPVDYLLYVKGCVAGTIEAKPVGHTLIGVELQSNKYDSGLAPSIPAWERPLLFSYQSTGVETRFTNRLDPQPRSREVFSFHRPEELRRLVSLGREGQIRARITAMPPLDATHLWSVQVSAIQNLERSLVANTRRSLIQMATGSGKTFTACNFVYRLAKFAGARRILFLVDRNTLGRQALNEFQKFTSPHTNRIFTEEYVVQHLRHNALDPASKVVITTIQRLYSMLQGKEEFDEANEEGSLFESTPTWLKEPVPVAYNPAFPIEAFDFIIVDECHRSIYNLWRQVLEYFDAFLIGLTATPTAQTVGFFNGNVVQDYSHEKAVADGVNVGYGVYRIRTEIGSSGAVIQGESGYFVPRRNRRTRQQRLAELDEDITYASTQLDRDVVNPSQIRTVIQTFRDRLFTEIFPGRAEVPKTLVFAKTDNHAEDIVDIIREEFGKGNDFCQKITSKTTGRKPEEILAEFRNSFNPRIAVTVDMIATGTDVKPLECLLFMRDIKSAAYFEQMKGRGCRVINPDDLQSVTPDAQHKTGFVIVDSVGVCESMKSFSSPMDTKPSVPFKKLLEAAAMGVADPDLASALASRLSSFAREITPNAEAEIASVAGQPLDAIIHGLLDSVDADANVDRARTRLDLKPDAAPEEKEIETSEREAVGVALKPFHNPRFRDLLIGLKAQLEQIIDEVNQDSLLTAGFDAVAQQKARSQLADFKKFIEDHKEEIDAIRLLYSRPYRAGLRFSQIKDLSAALTRPPLSLRDPVGRLWSLYEAAEPKKVKGRTTGRLVDLIALVRHALHPAVLIVPIRDEVEARYREWLVAREMAQRAPFTDEQRRWLDAIKDHIAESLAIAPEDLNGVPFSQMGGLGRAVQLFGDRWTDLLNELNERLAA